jgi:hypothetical protein
VTSWAWQRSERPPGEGVVPCALRFHLDRSRAGCLLHPPPRAAVMPTRRGARGSPAVSSCEYPLKTCSLRASRAGTRPEGRPCRLSLNLAERLWARAGRPELARQNPVVGRCRDGECVPRAGRRPGASLRNYHEPGAGTIRVRNAPRPVTAGSLRPVPRISQSATIPRSTGWSRRKGCCPGPEPVRRSAGAKPPVRGDAFPRLPAWYPVAWQPGRAAGSPERREGPAKLAVPVEPTATRSSRAQQAAGPVWGWHSTA